MFNIKQTDLAFFIYNFDNFFYLEIVRKSCKIKQINLISIPLKSSENHWFSGVLPISRGIEVRLISLNSLNI